jgi:NAD(P)-dependent dehydrogenase (short-subunit alcohol dehydrogenase family)
MFILDPESVHNFVQKLTKDTTGEFLRIDGIVLNGATKSRNHKQTKEGIELSLATNHMGHFLMVGLFLQKLLEQQGQSRIIFVGTDISTKDRFIYIYILYNMLGTRNNKNGF